MNVKRIKNRKLFIFYLNTGYNFMIFRKGPVRKIHTQKRRRVLLRVKRPERNVRRS